MTRKRELRASVEALWKADLAKASGSLTARPFPWAAWRGEALRDVLIEALAQAGYGEAVVWSGDLYVDGVLVPASAPDWWWAAALRRLAPDLGLKVREVRVHGHLELEVRGRPVLKLAGARRLPALRVRVAAENDADAWGLALLSAFTAGLVSEAPLPAEAATHYTLKAVERFASALGVPRVAPGSDLPVWQVLVVQDPPAGGVPGWFHDAEGNVRELVRVDLDRVTVPASAGSGLSGSVEVLRSLTVALAGVDGDLYFGPGGARVPVYHMEISVPHYYGMNAGRRKGRMATLYHLIPAPGAGSVN